VTQTYSDFIINWLSGIDNEIRYWNWWVLTGGGTYDQKHFAELKSGEAEFALEHLVKNYPVKILDVGTAILSTVGNKTPKGAVDLTAVDPLALGYANILRKNNLTPYVPTQFCMAETLTEKFAENTFDIVNMRNALDHSFDPIIGIYQMLYITKSGGRKGIVHLWHNKNEAEYEKYIGFHQWNIDA
jgi:SAM-dependent methyltransferase